MWTRLEMEMFSSDGSRRLIHPKPETEFMRLCISAWWILQFVNLIWRKVLGRRLHISSQRLFRKFYCRNYILWRKNKFETRATRFECQIEMNDYRWRSGKIKQSCFGRSRKWKKQFCFSPRGGELSFQWLIEFRGNPKSVRMSPLVVWTLRML